MEFDAGSVFAVLGAKVDPAGFVAYDAAIGRSTANAGRFEQRNNAASAAAARLGTAAKRAAVGGLGALAAAVTGSVVVAARFEKQMSEVRAVTGASEKDMRRLTKAARELGRESGLGATKTAKAVAELAKGGLTTQQILSGGLKGAIALAQAGQLDLATAAETTANALNLFALNGSQATHVADAMAQAANATTADVGDFALALSQGGAAAKAAGLSFDQTIVYLEAMANAGVKGSDAGTSMKAALTQIAKPTKQAADRMKELNLSFFDAQGKIKPLPTIARDLDKAFGGLSAQQRLQAAATIAGTDGMRGLLALYDSSPAELRKLQDGLAKQGTAADVAKGKTDNLSGSWDRFKARMQDVAIEVGGKALPELKDALDDVNDALDRFEKSGGIDKALDIDTAQITGDLGSIVDAVGDINDALHLSEGLGDSVTSGLRAVQGAVKAVGSLLRGDFKGALQGVEEVAAGAAGIIVAPLRATGRAAAEALSSPFRSAADTILGMFSSILSAGADVVGAMAGIPGIGGAFKGMASGIQSAADRIDELRENIRSIPQPKPLKAVVQAEQAKHALQALAGTKLEPKVLRVLGSDSDAKTKLKRLIALGIPPKTARVLAAVGGALAGIGSVEGAMHRLDGRVARVTVIQAFKQVGKLISGRAAGRGPGGGERALVGENQRNPREAIVDPARGTAMLVTGPTVMDLSPSAYVIPEDSAYRGRAMGLLAMLASDLGLKGFKTGKKPKRRRSTGSRSGDAHRPRKQRSVPGQVQPTRLPLDELDKKRTAEKQALDKAKTAEDADRRKVRSIRERRPKSDEAKRDKARDLERAREAQRTHHRQVLAHRARWRDLDRAWRQAKRYQEQITKQEQLADIAANQMRLADQRDDDPAYETARGKRTTALKALRDLLARARAALKDQDSEAARELDKQVSQADLDIQDAASAVNEPDESPAQRAAREAVERLEDTGMTDAERDLLGEIDKNIALAALTQGLEDDRQWAGAKEQFLSGILGLALSGNRALSGDVVADLAEQVARARDNLGSLTGGSGSNDNADVQAQIEQANQRTSDALEAARINRQALEVFGGAGDIGTGGFRNAMAAAAAAPNITINTLHPGDPRTLRAIGAAATAGQGLDGGRPSPRVTVGG